MNHRPSVFAHLPPWETIKRELAKLGYTWQQCGHCHGVGSVARQTIFETCSACRGRQGHWVSLRTHTV